MENLLVVILFVLLSILLRIRIRNTNIALILEKNKGKWTKEKIPINPKIYKNGFFWKNQFFSPVTGKFQPYDILKISPSGEEFVETNYYSIPGKTKGYRIERIAYVSVKNEVSN